MQISGCAGAGLRGRLLYLVQLTLAFTGLSKRAWGLKLGSV